MECQNCANCEDPLTDDWLKKFPDITYCALCVEELGEPNDTDIYQECSRCDTPLGYHHQKQCPVCSECHDWCGHMIAFTPNFLFEGPQLCRWKNSKPIDRFIEAHGDYGKAYWEARERLGDDAQFLPLWNDLQDKHNATLKAIYGEGW